MGASPILVPGKSIVFFDAYCLLCSRFVNILLKYDKQGFYYSGFDSAVANKILPDSLRSEPQTIVLYQNEKLLLRSEAVFEILKRLRTPWSFFSVFSILPSSLTDMVYNWLARNRLAWFGRSESCFIPTPEQKNRFFE